MTFYQTIRDSFSLHLMSPGGLCLKKGQLGPAGCLVAPGTGI